MGDQVGGGINAGVLVEAAREDSGTTTVGVVTVEGQIERSRSGGASSLSGGRGGSNTSSLSAASNFGVDFGLQGGRNRSELSQQVIGTGVAHSGGEIKVSGGGDQECAGSRIGELQGSRLIEQG